MCLCRIKKHISRLHMLIRGQRSARAAGDDSDRQQLLSEVADGNTSHMNAVCIHGDVWTRPAAGVKRKHVSAALIRLYWSVWGFPRDRRKHPHWTSEEGNNWLVYVIFISNSRVCDFMWLDQIEHIKAHSDRNFITDGGFNKRHKTPVLDQFPRGRRWTLTTLQTAANNRIDQSLPKNTPQGSMSPSRTLELS